MAEEQKAAAAKVAAKADEKKADEKKAQAAGAEAPAEGAPNIEEMKKKFKPKKKVTLPTEMLSDAKSYDDKLLLVKMLTEKERNRMILIVKNMLKDSLSPAKK